MHRSTPWLVCARYAWVLWTGTASALQSSDYGNVGPVGSWTKLSSAPEYEQCVVERDKTVAAFLGTHPQAAKRTEDVVFEKSTVPGDEDMIVHTATSFLCLPDYVDPEKVKSGEYKPPQKPIPEKR